MNILKHLIQLKDSDAHMLPSEGIEANGEDMPINKCNTDYYKCKANYTIPPPL
jgi:hypothetical protein